MCGHLGPVSLIVSVRSFHVQNMVDNLGDVLVNEAKQTALLVP